MTGNEAELLIKTFTKFEPELTPVLLMPMYLSFLGRFCFGFFALAASLPFCSGRSPPSFTDMNNSGNQLGTTSRNWNEDSQLKIQITECGILLFHHHNIQRAPAEHFDLREGYSGFEIMVLYYAHARPSFHAAHCLSPFPSSISKW